MWPIDMSIQSTYHQEELQFALSALKFGHLPRTVGNHLLPAKLYKILQLKLSDVSNQALATMQENGT